MFPKVMAQSLYSLTGAIFLIAGTSVLLLGTNLLPDGIRHHIVVDAARGDTHTLHLLQVLGCLLLFAGLITLWFVWHYDQSGLFHWAMTLFWALFAVVHYVDPTGRFRNESGAWMAAIPFALFAVVGVLRRRG